MKTVRQSAIAKKRSTRGLATLDDFLKDEGVYDDFKSQAIKETIAWQLREAMTRRKLSRTQMAAIMGTSRSQIARLLDPDDFNVTIATLQKAAEAVGRKVRLELV